MLNWYVWNTKLITQDYELTIQNSKLYAQHLELRNYQPNKLNKPNKLDELNKQQYRNTSTLHHLNNS
jgi:hypothetical protein